MLNTELYMSGTNVFPSANVGLHLFCRLHISQRMIGTSRRHSLIETCCVFLCVTVTHHRHATLCRLNVKMVTPSSCSCKAIERLIYMRVCVLLQSTRTGWTVWTTKDGRTSRSSPTLPAGGNELSTRVTSSQPVSEVLGVIHKRPRSFGPTQNACDLMDFAPSASLLLTSPVCLTLSLFIFWSVPVEITSRLNVHSKPARQLQVIQAVT